MAGKPHCPACKTAISARKGELCVDCATAALGAYGWTNGAPDGKGGLRRGAADPVAAADLARRVDVAPAPSVGSEPMPPAETPAPAAPSRIRALWATRIRLSDGFVHAVRFGAIYEGKIAAELVRASPTAFAVLA